MFSTNLKLNEEDLKNLREYKYKSGSCTPFDNFLDLLASSTIHLIPKSWSPNAITLIGFILNLIGILCLDLLKTESGSISRYAYLICAVMTFIYMYMDTLDGKQARRLGCSSPLGQLFDHGCDSLTCSCLLYSVIRATGIEDNRLISIMYAVVGCIFVSFQLIEYFQDVLMAGVSFCGVSEIEMAAVIVNLISFIWGREIWNTSVTFEISKTSYSITAKMVVIFFIIFIMGGAVFIKNMIILIQGSKIDGKEETHKNNSRIDHAKRFIPLM